MRENRPSGSEGGGAESKQPSLPLSKRFNDFGQCYIWLLLGSGESILTARSG